MDQMSLSFQATLTQAWAPKGQTPVVRTRSQRDHIDFYGTLEVRGGREITLPAPEQTSEVTADFIRILLVLFPTQTLLLLLDRASWNKGPAAQEVIEENDRLHVMYFPVACPDLNSQEHVWALAREAVSHNHDYRDFDQLINDFEAYLNENLFESNFMDKYLDFIHLVDTHAIWAIMNRGDHKEAVIAPHIHSTAEQQ
jgi:transposase